MRAAVYGAGAMGTVLGAYIAGGGGECDLISRNIKHISALKNRGARITGTVNFSQKVSALLPEEMVGKYDIVFLMTKQRENRAICKFLTGFLADEGVICTMQNGLPENSVAEVVGEERCLGCAVSWGATFHGEGCAELTSNPKKLTFSLGALCGSNKKIPEVAELLSFMGKVYVTDNLIGARWAKLAVNSAFSPLSAITGLTFGDVARGRTSKKLALALLNEAFAVAKADGVEIEKIQGRDIVKLFSCSDGIKKRFALALLPLAMKNHKNLISGMYYDLTSGKKSDMEFINGAVARVAAQRGVSVPLNLKILEIVNNIEKGILTPSAEILKLI